MIMAYMEVQCFEMWGKVKIEKLQNDPSLVSHSIFFCVDERVFQCLLIVVHSNLNINMDSNKRVHKQTNNNNNQTNKHVWVFKKRTQPINLTESH